MSRISVTGCSYAGKMALFSGAFDERIALTIAQESGGGGAPSWRVSETLGEVEKLGSTDDSWFMQSMFQFSGTNVSKLPHDHHELMAMVAPRALLVTGNVDFFWLANPSCYVSAKATEEIYRTFGIEDRFGFYIDGGHGHCAIPENQVPAIEAFVDKFLLGQTEVVTDTVRIHPYTDVDHERWYQWWGTDDPVFPPEPNSIKLWLEPECATVGTDWEVVNDTEASNETYVTIQSGLNSTDQAPTGDNAAIVIPFVVDSAGVYNFRARVNCASADDDSYWVKIDDGAFETVNGLATSGWEWVTLMSETLSLGAHTLTIAYREDGAHLDKVLVTTSGSPVDGLGALAINCGFDALSLVSFTATAQSNGSVKLNWQVAAESPNQSYRLERSQDGDNYLTINSVTAKGSVGENSTYSYIDDKPAKGINYYRLVQMEENGKATVLGIKTVNTLVRKSSLNVFPNPASSQINIDLGSRENTQKQVRMFNILGELVLEKFADVQNGMIRLDLSRHLGKGVYYIQVGVREQISVVLQ